MASRNLSKKCICFGTNKNLTKVEKTMHATIARGYLGLKTVLLVCAISALALAKTTDGDAAARKKRQHHLGFQTRRSGRPPPYAVQMEPIAHYSPRDPLYNPLAESKSDVPQYYEDSPYNYYPTEPEPIIEIIIKESNETLPPQPPIHLPAPSKPKKEPIQVFYVKYEKKQEHGEEHPRVVYDTPVPALVPVEEHEELHPDEPAAPAPVVPVTPAPPVSTTTLRAIIRPDSETYHAPTGSGLRVTFGNDQLPPNQHNKRSDQVSSPRRQHGPFAPVQSGASQRPAFSQPLGPIVQAPQPNFALQPQLHQQQPLLSQRPVSPLSPIAPIARPSRPAPSPIQGLPEHQQRQPFVNRPQPGGLSHQNVQLQNYVHQQQLPHPAPVGFNFDPQAGQIKQRQQQQDKQRYFEQQQRLAEQKRQQEQARIQEQQRRKQEQDQKRQLHYQHEQDQNRLQQQQFQHQQYQQQHFKYVQQGQKQQQQQPQVAQQQPQQVGGEILRSIPKLEQHYAIRENPLHPGPFPPNPQYADIPSASFNAASHQYSQQSNLVHQAQPQLPVQSQNVKVGPAKHQLLKQQHIQQQQLQQQQQQQSQQQQQQLQNHQNRQHQQQQSQQQQQQQQQQYQQNQQQQHQLQYTRQPSTPQDSQQFFLKNLPSPQQLRPQQEIQYQQQQQLSLQQAQPQPQPQAQNNAISSIWGRQPIFRNSNEKIFATPVTKIQYPTSPSPTTTPRPYTTAAATTAAPAVLTTTSSPKHDARIKANIERLPDEVPDDIREQLLSSGILGNADIQILDYDKVGGVNIGDLPPEALAQFYGAGGAAGAASEPKPRLAKRPKLAEDELQETAASTSGVEMKVVRFDPRTMQGQKLAEGVLKENATQLSAVQLGSSNSNDAQYNRYLPLKVSGASFPIPSAAELEGRRISSVVVLAPVDGLQQPTQRNGRKVAASQEEQLQSMRFFGGESLKQLVRKPTADNYKRWLEHERRSPLEKQAIVLLVTKPRESPAGSQADQAIFMYDVTSESVSQLEGDLTPSFYDAAESNVNDTASSRSI
ncbi:transcription initiation factor TFIID subunit 12b-like [Trichogramma pretiosum]|uniref:transcription initiation factor TFIID subunit 12b-like n=1 Tax=Trichogramma pretiosum TaxID=7493 RepID=UPI0006C9BB17|nr:transcription initiation factor TFIID subunit 12b-like [Trichogramma pretiosum]